MSSGPWGTVYSIAARRSQTNEGENTLTDHALEVLHAFTMAEHAQAMTDALGAVYGRFDF